MKRWVIPIVWAFRCPSGAAPGWYLHHAAFYIERAVKWRFWVTTRRGHIIRLCTIARA